MGSEIAEYGPWAALTITALSVAAVIIVYKFKGNNKSGNPGSSAFTVDKCPQHAKVDEMLKEGKEERGRLRERLDDFDKELKVQTKNQIDILLKIGGIETTNASILRIVDSRRRSERINIERRKP